ncbi:glycosyltransferase family 2 protein [Robertkochia solimangrovi]|uniref:glycosyltransferase family 2 protein n=1 Tax=Robertkochia solimangrovi TaxID=2213046 RepID=UPI001180A861|nr:glycosyltransferase family 2 protein [Robertkochia solimangrovi]TRZ44985.1 hypothetical protein DMZ48_04280 [Robertkochia solimangrovi]
MSPLVSVLMTVYNREEYIAQAIESVLNSTFNSWELIIVDDGSTDSSLEIANKYAKTDSRIHVYMNEVNLGDYPNRNKAASYAKGKYLKYVDADDLIYPYGLEQLVFYMDQFPEAGYGLCSLEQDSNRIYPFCLNSEETFRRNYIEGKSIFHKAPLSSIIRKDAFDQVGGFSEVRHFGDFEMWHKLSMRYPLVLMPHGIVWYRVSANQEAAKRRAKPLLPVMTFQAAENYVLKEDFPLKGEERIQVKKQYEKLIASAVIFGYRKWGIKTGNEIRKLAKLNYTQLIVNKFLN